jgi:AAA+ superfamily predicted ATPase
MKEIADEGWAEANQRYLTARLASVRLALERQAALARSSSGAEHNAEHEGTPPNAQPEPAEVNTEVQSADQDWNPNFAPPALDQLSEMFLLSRFEQDLLLLCAGLEFDSRFSSLCASAQGDARLPYATLSLALAALPDAHWNALTPNAPLRRWRLIEITHAGESLLRSQLRIDERVLHYLAGISYIDQRLEGLVKPFTLRRDLPLSQQQIADHIAHCWTNREGSTEWRIVLLCGHDQISKWNVAAHACAMLGLRLCIMRATEVPQAVAEREAFARLWEREALLLGGALLLEQGKQEMPPAALSLIDSLHGVLFGSVPESLELLDRPVLRLEVRKPGAAEQRSLWTEVLGPAASRMNGELDRIVSQFSMGTDAIHTAGDQVREGLAQAGEDAPDDGLLWDACRLLARTRLDDLAQRLEPAATWEDIVLPETQLRALREIAAHVRQRAKVYGTWGFASKGERGLGISALFAGASGTGKTMAAEVLANDLRLDLYKIDLSQVVSKYIGETEKNLHRVFDAAEEGGAILLFDEADALFGKRSEVKDSHDRYANIEVSYLLQRMEAYRGLAILTTNLKNAVDPAFLRRLRFVVQFPFPDATQRTQIWRHIFPSDTPLLNADFGKLARLSIPGGNIRNVALHAAFLAAEANESVTMTHLLHAARSEYTKLDKPLTEAEIGGWV